MLYSRLNKNGDKLTLFVWFKRVYGVYNVGNIRFPGSADASPGKLRFQQYNHHIPVRTQQKNVRLSPNSIDTQSGDDWGHHT